MGSTVVQTVQNLFKPEIFAISEICCLDCEWYNSTNNTKLVRSQKYGNFLKNVIGNLSGTVVQTVQNCFELKIFAISAKVSVEI